MEDDSDDKADFTDDPEIAALLDFEAVVRRCRRSNGWTPGNQRRFIVALVGTGRVALAAHAVGCAEAGAWKVRYSGGAEGFAAAWDGALALHLRRNPRPAPKGRPSRGEILAGSGRAWPAAAPAPAPPGENEIPVAELFDHILQTYLMKLEQERESRLAGRIVEADFIVRQLTWLEVVLDLGGRGQELMDRLGRGGHRVGDIVATPISVLLGDARRALWEDLGEPERPPPPGLGICDGELSFGELDHYSSAHCGPDPDAFWRRLKQQQGIAAEAQKAWEEKAEADASSWRARMEIRDDGAGDEPKR